MSERRGGGIFPFQSSPIPLAKGEDAGMASLPQPKKSQDRQNDHDEANEIDDGVHGRWTFIPAFLEASGTGYGCGRVCEISGALQMPGSFGLRVRVTYRSVASGLAIHRSTIRVPSHERAAGGNGSLARKSGCRVDSVRIGWHALLVGDIAPGEQDGDHIG